MGKSMIQILRGMFIVAVLLGLPALAFYGGVPLPEWAKAVAGRPTDSSDLQSDVQAKPVLSLGHSEQLESTYETAVPPPSVAADIDPPEQFPLQAASKTDSARPLGARPLRPAVYRPLEDGERAALYRIPADFDIDATPNSIASATHDDTHHDNIHHMEQQLRKLGAAAYRLEESEDGFHFQCEFPSEQGESQRRVYAATADSSEQAMQKVLRQVWGSEAALVDTVSIYR